jgi:low affinity Fe/Cu permease
MACLSLHQIGMQSAPSARSTASNGRKRKRSHEGILDEAAKHVRERRQRHGIARSVAEFFRRFAQRSAEAFGSSWAFVAALAVVLVWAATGPLFHFSDTWQLVINTGTTVVTFLMVFLIQNAQNRDAKALHLKLDELINSIRTARNRLITLEDCTDEELEELEEEFKRLAKRRQSAAAD